MFFSLGKRHTHNKGTIHAIVLQTLQKGHNSKYGDLKISDYSRVVGDLKKLVQIWHCKCCDFMQCISNVAIDQKNLRKVVVAGHERKYL